MYVCTLEEDNDGLDLWKNMQKLEGSEVESSGSKILDNITDWNEDRDATNKRRTAKYVSGRKFLSRV